jgi:hypothetical protein
MKTLLMKVILVVMVSFITTLSNAQTFKCTSIVFGKEVSTSKQQKLKEEALGSKMECEFFKTDIKATISYEYKGESRKAVLIFVKEGDIYSSDKFILKMKKSLGFITEINLINYSHDDKYVATIIFERELF